MTAELETDEFSNGLFIVRRKLSALIEVEVEVGGKWLHTYENLRISKYSIEENIAEESEDSAIEIEDSTNYLITLSPQDWKNQDHYVALGLAKHRYRARYADIRKAYHTLLRRIHPDKKKTNIPEENASITCIKIAHDILIDPIKRRSYDSVDPEFDDDIPPNNTKTKNNFFLTYGPVFTRNAHWSVRKDPPQLGDKDDNREKVENFYNFWFDFDTWREFSYLDEEEKEKGSDREERRYIERQNNLQRSKKKREEISRLMKLVENAYKSDPRIVKFKEEDKEKKIALKRAKQEAIRKKQAEIGMLRREELEKERKLKEEEEEKLKIKQEIEKKEREAAKKLAKKEKRFLRNFCKDNGYFSMNATEKITCMTDMELLCEGLQMVKLQELNKNLSSADETGRKTVFMSQVAEVKQLIQREKMGSSYQSKSESMNNSSSRTKSWNSDDLRVLIKAVNLFPAGTAKRWEVVAEYVNQHGSKAVVRNAKDIIAKAKELQASDEQLRNATNKNAYEELVKNQNSKPLISDSHASQRLEEISVPQEIKNEISKWSPEEQKLLEQAMKTYPANTAARWDRIAECLPNKSKKECMARYKELVERVKAKKAAQIAAGVSK